MKPDTKNNFEPVTEPDEVNGRMQRLVRFVLLVPVSIITGQITCKKCFRPQVGLSIYCRRHTDEILGYSDDARKTETPPADMQYLGEYERTTLSMVTPDAACSESSQHHPLDSDKPLSEDKEFHRLTYQQMEKMLVDVRAKKKTHKRTSDCKRESRLGGCTACHFFSGSIAALTESLGHESAID